MAFGFRKYICSFFGNIFFVSNSSEPQCIEALLLSVLVLCFQSILSYTQWPAGSAAAAGLGQKFVASVKIPGRPPSVPCTAAPRPERRYSFAGWP